MTHYLISFPASAMHLTPENYEQISESSRAVIREAKDAGVYVFGGGINADVPAVTVSATGEQTDAATYLDGGFAVLTLPSREEALAWAAKLAAGCHCPQELREFHWDPES